MEASHQWAVRPIDETFWGLDDTLIAAEEMKRLAAESTVPFDSLHVEAEDQELRLVGKKGIPAYFTFSAMNQLCAKVGVPHGFIKQQPATLAAQNLNWGLKENRGNSASENAVLLLHRGDRLMVRATTTERYSRYWNANLLKNAKVLLDDSWKVPPARPSGSRMDDPRIRPATKEDIIIGSKSGLGINIDDKIGPAGVYLSDKDLFAFLWNDNVIEGPSGPLHKFLIIKNNEIGTGKWSFMFGYADGVCGNHILWGTSGVKEISVRHIGDNTINRNMQKVKLELKEYSEEASSTAENLLKNAATFEIKGNKEEIIETVFDFARKHRLNVLSSKKIEAAYNIAESVGRYGNPNTPWAIHSGLTELSQRIDYADERTDLDRAAGKVLEMAF
jgi:hypothetical protein